MYTTDRVVNIIKNYHANYVYVHELANQVNQSVGVGQYGIESTLPKGTGISNVVEKQALKTLESRKNMAEKLTDMKYLQDRWHRITDEQQAIILQLFLMGNNTHDVAVKLKKSKETIRKELRKIAEQITYPQESTKKPLVVGD